VSGDENDREIGEIFAELGLEAHAGVDKEIARRVDEVLAWLNEQECRTVRDEVMRAAAVEVVASLYESSKQLVGVGAVMSMVIAAQPAFPGPTFQLLAEAAEGNQERMRQVAIAVATVAAVRLARHRQGGHQ
jgi:hypothetical protein